MWPATHSRPHRSAEQSKDWTPDLLSHPARASPTETFSLSGGGAGDRGGNPCCPTPPSARPASLGSCAHLPASPPSPRHLHISSLSARLPRAGSSAGHTPLLHRYARRSLVHHLSPPSVWERQGKGRRQLGLEGGVGKSAPAWLWIRAGSACVRTEGWMMDWMSWSKERMQISGVRRSEDSENERSAVGKDGRGLSPVSHRLARYGSARLQVWGWQSCLPTLSLPP